MSTTYATRPIATPGSVRLTRRGRLVVFCLALLVVLAVSVVLAASSLATEEPEATQTITVGSGETLWDIAAEAADDGDVRAMITHIQDLNDLDSGVLMAGPELVVPA